MAVLTRASNHTAVKRAITVNSIPQIALHVNFKRKGKKMVMHSFLLIGQSKIKIVLSVKCAYHASCGKIGLV